MPLACHQPHTHGGGPVHFSMFSSGCDPSVSLIIATTLQR